MGSKTGAKTVKDLGVRVNDLHAYFENELHKFRTEIKTIKTPEVNADGEMVSETVLNRFDLFEATIRNEIQGIKADLDKLNSVCDNLNRKTDKILQNSYRHALLLHGIEEKPEEDIMAIVFELFNGRLGLALQKNDIDMCSRFGIKKSATNHKNSKQSRPILVEFITMWQRNEVFYKKKVLKGTGLIITELLSPYRYSVYRLVRDEVGKNTWTKNCRIGFSIDGKVHYVATKESFEKIRGGASSSDTPERREREDTENIA